MNVGGTQIERAPEHVVDRHDHRRTARQIPKAGNRVVGGRHVGGDGHAALAAGEPQQPRFQVRRRHHPQFGCLSECGPQRIDVFSVAGEEDTDPKPSIGRPVRKQPVVDQEPVRKMLCSRLDMCEFLAFG